MSSAESIHRFGRFELDLRRRELRDEAGRVPLQPRVFALLCYFAERPGRAISREELLARVWADVIVTDASLTKAVRILRSVLSRDPALRGGLETVRGHGYRFTASEASTVARRRRGDRLVDADRPFVGRAGELAQIAERLGGVLRGGQGMILVVGEPGIGKTALARQALELASPDLLVGRGQCIEIFGEQSPYLPVADAIVQLARTGSEPERSRIRSILRRIAPSWIHQLPALFPDEGLEPPLVELRPESMAVQVLAALEAIADVRPTVLFLDDIQWADQSTLDLLHRLAHRSSPTGLLTICTVRTAELERSEGLRALRAEVARMTGGLTIEPRPIALEGIREYAAWGLRRSGSDAIASSDLLADWLSTRTGGNPLFLSQLVDHLESLGLLSARGDEPFSAVRLDEAGIPSTLKQLIRHWSARLDASDRLFLEAASVAGDHFDLRAIQAALEWEREAAEASCDRLCREGWIAFRDFEQWLDGSRGARLRFEHVLYREALQEAIAPNRRARLHRAIARRVQAGNPNPSAHSSELATHFELSGAYAEGARQRVAAAAFAALRRSVSETLHHGQLGLRALGFLPAEERTSAEIDLRLAIGMAHAARSGFGELPALEAFERARELARTSADPQREVAAVWGIATCRKMRGEIESAREDGLRLLDLAESTGDARARVLALDLLCSVAFFQGRFADCLALKKRIDEVLDTGHRDAWLARSVDDVRVTAQAYCAIAEWHLGDPRRAVSRIEDAIEGAGRLGNLYTTAFVAGFAACVAHIVGDHDEQQRQAARGLAISERSGIALWAAIARFMSICSRPPSPTALPELRSALAEMARFGGLGGTFFVGLLVDHELAVGDVEAGARLCRAGIERAESTTECHALPMLYVTAARLAEGDTDRRAYFEKAQACARRMGSVMLEARVAQALAEEASA